ncbi:hypothetical protein UYSO10_2466 [Kosakonia radicincitans]|nr:hypothetical protein UYSO10_2466 [Kosakonia radicincitans]
MKFLKKGRAAKRAFQMAIRRRDDSRGKGQEITVPEANKKGRQSDPFICLYGSD